MTQRVLFLTFLCFSFYVNKVRFRKFRKSFRGIFEKKNLAEYSDVVLRSKVVDGWFLHHVTQLGDRKLLLNCKYEKP